METLKEQLKYYLIWCNKKGFNKNNPKSLDLFIKDQMDITDQEIISVKDKEVGSAIEKNDLIRIDTKVGTFFLIEAQDEDFAYVVLDSNKYFLGNLYTEQPEEFIKQLKAINHIADICNLGVCDWMIFATSKEELLDELNEIICEENKKYNKNYSMFTLDDLKYGEFEFYNIVGNNHILVDMD